jgi:DNA-binding CsgD family transcriptional regulator
VKLATADLVSVVEAAYSPAPDDKSWLAHVIEVFDRTIDSPLGCHGFFLDASALDDVRIGEAETSCLRVPLDVVRASVPANAEEARPFYGSKYVGTGSGQIGVDAWHAFPAYQQYYKPAGVEDILGVVCLDSIRVGCVLAVPLRRRVRLGARQEAHFSRLAIHVATALRLRRSLSAGASHHGTEGDATGSSVRRDLRRMARDVDRARSRLRREDPDEALEIWTALVSGRWTLLDHFDSDGRRFLVARENSPSVHQPSALTALERAIAASAALGRSQKLIAYELGLNPALVSSTLASAVQKLGVRSTAELAAMLGVFAPARS